MVTNIQRAVLEGFMHVDITENLKKCLARPPRKAVKSNIQSHNSIAAVLSSKTDSSSVEMPSLALVADQTKSTAPAKFDEQKSKPPERMIKLEVELHDNEENNIGHISICAVIKKPTDEVKHRSR